MADEKPEFGARLLGGMPTVGGFLMVAGLTIWRNGNEYSKGLLDDLMLGFFILLMVWFLLPRRDKSGVHEQSDNRVALRLGKSLKRVLRR